MGCGPCVAGLVPMQALTCSGQLSYLGTSWRKDVTCAGYGVSLNVSPGDEGQAEGGGECAAAGASVAVLLVVGLEQCGCDHSLQPGDGWQLQYAVHALHAAPSPPLRFRVT